MSRKSRRRKSGVSLVRIIVVAAVFLLIVGAVMVAVKGWVEAERASRLTENVVIRFHQRWSGQENSEQTGNVKSKDEISGTETLGAETMEAMGTEAEIQGTKAPETATTVPIETEPVKLETLDGISAGTELSREELDFEDISKYFQAYEVKTTGASYQRINGKSYRENPDVSLSDLRYIKVLHYNFNHQLQVGEIIVNKGLAEDMISIFRQLYDAEYEIQSMHLVDNYWTGDSIDSDSASIDVNNTSAFSYRPAVGSKKLSNHAYGFAIDINPQQNPYVSYSSGTAKWEHKNANDYIARDTGLPHVITHEDTAYKIFTAHGFKWGGDWKNPKDYQHFEKKLY